MEKKQKIPKLHISGSEINPLDAKLSENIDSLPELNLNLLQERAEEEKTVNLDVFKQVQSESKFKRVPYDILDQEAQFNWFLSTQILHLNKKFNPSDLKTTIELLNLT